MARYFLTNPETGKGKLEQKGQSWDKPIYHCRQTNTLWLLDWTPSGRYLIYLDKETGHIDPSRQFSVPTDWEGEPQSIGIREEIWMHIINQGEGVDIAEDVKELIRNGDYLYKIDFEGRITHRILLEGNEFKLVLL
ncbi:MAG TPA: hypothetical protein PLK80_06940 [bacterium]|nr:MAG: hypothetical protein BWY28_02196 [bacterium ADurb.Bin236]HOY62142.1 hypothetical protein [bacterium]HPI76455.1 hypothetical protein [bacterium]HPN93709.1 hypothetical protein [bacterium]